MFLKKGNILREAGPAGCLRALVEHSGWFSENKKKVTNFCETTVGMVFSYGNDDRKNIFNYENSFIPLS